MECPPSAMLERGFPNETSSYAEEGSYAHALAELKLSRAVANTVKPRAFKKMLAELQADPLFSTSLDEYVDLYVSQVTERYMAAVDTCKDALALLEQKLDFSQWVPGGFGTGDVVIIADDVVEVIDLKYGKGVPVSAENNPQTRLYGLGAVDTYGALYDFSRVRMTIIQPRLDSISTEEMTVEDLVAWGDEYVKPRAALAIAGEGEYRAGDHCRFCKARATCRARGEANLELAKYDFKPGPLYNDDEIADILIRADEFQKWAKDIQEFALYHAERGKKWPGWKLVEGRSNRKYTDLETVSKILVEAGYKEDDIYTRSLLGITAMEKAIGKKSVSELLNELIVKPPGKPVLVPESDKRPEFSSADAAAKDFAEDVLY